VGLPAEVGLHEAHRALTEAGMRAAVELWCDGGMKTAEDVLRCVLLGANRVAFGTLAMVAVGCTICRACQTDTCHVGITTQVETEAEALAKGFRRFVPRDPEAAADGLARVLCGIGETLAATAGSLGYARVQDLVGRGEHLRQVRGLERLDLRPWLVSLPVTAADASTPGAQGEDAAPTKWAAEEGASPAAWPTEPRHQRMVGTALAGEWVRRQESEAWEAARLEVRMEAAGVVGQGLGAFHTEGMDTVIAGGAQDGAAKGALGGRIAVLKARTADGAWRDGSVGKSFAYGAQGGTFFVQGDADSRAAVRLSGGSVVFGARPHGIVDGSAVRANLKGFAFEYMTGGTVLCLGDPGPWLCAGMTGGVVYVRMWPELGLNGAAVRSRLARGALCEVSESLTSADARCIGDLLHAYADLLTDVGQGGEAAWVRSLLPADAGAFAHIRPRGAQVPDDVSTE
jgi:glutamate synthase (NADPH/NADH) large chain